MECGAVMCLQDKLGAPGCITFNTLNKADQFYCIICLPRKHRHIPYAISGFGNGNPTKLTWPLLFMTCTLSGLDPVLAKNLEEAMKYQYRNDQANVNIGLLSKSMAYL